MDRPAPSFSHVGGPRALEIGAAALAIAIAPTFTLAEGTVTDGVADAGGALVDDVAVPSDFESLHATVSARSASESETILMGERYHRVLRFFPIAPTSATLLSRMALIGILLAILVPIFLLFMGITWLVERAAGQSQARAIASGFGAVAKTLDCKYVSADGTLEGTLDGASFKVDRFTITASAAGTIGQTSQVTFTRVVATTDGIPSSFALTIAKSGILGSVATSLGAEDLVVGQPAFDAAFRVKSNVPALVRRIVDAELAARLLQIASVDFTVKNGIVIATHGGVVVDPNLLIPMIRASAILATAIAAASATETPAFR